MFQQKTLSYFELWLNLGKLIIRHVYCFVSSYVHTYVYDIQGCIQRLGGRDFPHRPHPLAHPSHLHRNPPSYMLGNTLFPPPPQEVL